MLRSILCAVHYLCCVSVSSSTLCMCVRVRVLLHRAIDASYIDPDTMDFEGQEWVLPDEPQPKPDKVGALG